MHRVLKANFAQPGKGLGAALSPTQYTSAKHSFLLGAVNRIKLRTESINMNGEK